ncbi:MAG: FlgO family outer membrane protein [Rhodopila sp.]
MKLLAVILPVGVAVAGCGTLDPNTAAFGSGTIGSAPAASGDLGSLTYRAVDLILAGAPDVTGETSLVVASISDVQNVDASSPLGNIVSDMVKTRLVQDGHTVSEMRLRAGVHLAAGEGDFALSRNRRVLAPPPRAAAVLTGTYAVSFERVYVSLRLVSSSDSRILSGADFVVPRRDVAGLLEKPQPGRG